MAATASASVDTSSVPKMVWVKDLTESNITSIPSRYAYSDSAYSNATINRSKDDNPDVVVGANIPTIDFSLLTSSSPDERSKAIQELGKACREWGFFLVINHGVPEKLMKGMLDAVQDFFNQPEEEKLRGAGKGMLDPIRSGTSFNSSVEKVLFWRDFLKVWVHPEFYSPPSPPDFSEISFEYSKTIRQVTRELLKGISESLGLEECSIEKAVELESGFQILIANLYPTCPQPELALGMPPHSDHGLLTILTQNEVDGLEIVHDGKWVNVKALPNSFLVNTGDHLEILSNGKYKSVLHRVAVNNKAARISIAMAHGPNLEKVVAPAPELVNNHDNPPAYLGMKYKEFLLLQQSNQLDMKTVLDRLRV